MNFTKFFHAPLSVYFQIWTNFCFIHTYLYHSFIHSFIDLTLSWRRPLSYRNQSIDLQSKSMDWFLYDDGLRHESVKLKFLTIKFRWDRLRNWVEISNDAFCVWKQTNQLAQWVELHRLTSYNQQRNYHILRVIFSELFSNNGLEILGKCLAKNQKIHQIRNPLWMFPWDVQEVLKTVYSQNTCEWWM